MRPISIFRHAMVSMFFAALAPVPAGAQPLDPPYQQQMERLGEVMGGLYFLQPLCEQTQIDWRAQMADLIALEEPTQDREARLAGAFNSGYASYARFYRSCTESAREAMRRLLAEGASAAQDMHSRYAE